MGTIYQLIFELIIEVLGFCGVFKAHMAFKVAQPTKATAAIAQRAWIRFAALLTAWTTDNVRQFRQVSVFVTHVVLEVAFESICVTAVLHGAAPDSLAATSLVRRLRVELVVGGARPAVPHQGVESALTFHVSLGVVLGRVEGRHRIEARADGEGIAHGLVSSTGGPRLGVVLHGHHARKMRRRTERVCVGIAEREFSGVVLRLVLDIEKRACRFVNPSGVLVE